MCKRVKYNTHIAHVFCELSLSVVFLYLSPIKIEPWHFFVNFARVGNLFSIGHSVVGKALRLNFLSRKSGVKIFKEGLLLFVRKKLVHFHKLIAAFGYCVVDLGRHPARGDAPVLV